MTGSLNSSLVRAKTSIARPRAAGARLLLVPSTPSLAEALDEFRLNHELSIRAAGRMVGASHWAWAKWESGSIPSPRYLRLLASLLGLPIAQARALAGPDRVRRASTVGENDSSLLAQARVAVASAGVVCELAAA